MSARAKNGKELTVESGSRRGILTRGLTLVAATVGSAFAGRSASAALTPVIATRPPGELRLVARDLHAHVHGRASGERPDKGDSFVVRGDLFDASGRRVGELCASGVALRPPGGDESEPLSQELHTFVVEDGSITGSGVSRRAGGAFAIHGGTGRYEGARGSYVARQSPRELGGDGGAVFVFRFVEPIEVSS